MDVRVAALVVALNGLDHLGGLLARGGRVQIDQGLPVHGSRQDREVPPALLAERHRATALPFCAPLSTESGRVTHLIRDGLISFSIFLSIRLSLQSCARSAGWPSTISSRR